MEVIQQLQNLDENQAIFEEYQVIEMLGKGGFCKVYRAKRWLDNKICALKVLNKLDSKESKIKWTRMEADVLKSLDYKYVIRMLEYFETDSMILIVMEVAEGGDLWGYMKKYRKVHGKMLPEKACSRIVKHILQALHYVHKQRMIHRDVKPGK